MLPYGGPPIFVPEGYTAVTRDIMWKKVLTWTFVDAEA